MTIESPPADTISLPAAARLLRVDGKSPSPVSLWRWARKGKCGVRLQVWKRGRQLVTTEEAVREFDRAVAEADARRWAERSGEPITTATSHQDIEARARSLGV